MDSESIYDDGSESEEPEPVEYKPLIIDSSTTNGWHNNGEVSTKSSSENGYTTETVASVSKSSPSIVIATTTPSTNGVNSAHVNDPSLSNTGIYLITEATRISSDIKRLKGELVVARKRIQEQDLELEESRQEILRQEEKLREAEEIITEQQNRVERMEEENRSLESGVNVDVRELKGLVGTERTKRVEVEAKYDKMRDSFKSLSEEFKQLIQLWSKDQEKEKQRLPPPKMPSRRHDDEDEYEDIVPQENKLETLTTFVENKFMTWTETQLKMKAELLNTQKIALNLTQVLNSIYEDASSRSVSNTLSARTAHSNLSSHPAPPSILPAAIEVLKNILVTRNLVTHNPVTPIASALHTPVGNTQHRVDESKSGQGFFCICGPEYSSKSSLNTHIRTFTETGKFKCDICKSRFVLYYMLRRHEKEKHNIVSKGVIGCAPCGKVFTSNSNLYSHRRLAHSKPGKSVRWKLPPTRGKRTMKSISYYCDDDEKEVDDDKGNEDENVDVDTVVESDQEETEHTNSPPRPPSMEVSDPGRMLPHGVDPSNNCRCLCGIEYSHRINLFKHVDYYTTTEKKFSCSKCSKRFVAIETLRSHHIRAHGGKYRKSNFANIKIGGGGVTERRESSDATIEVDQVSTRENRAPSSVFYSGLQHGMNIALRHQGFFCTCGVKFISRKNLDAHVLFQNYGQRHYTDVGGTDEEEELKEKNTSPKTSNQIHGVDPTKPDQCLCGYKRGKKKLVGHLAYHAERKSFICNACPARFVGIWYLKRHMLRTHTDVNISAVTSNNTQTECGQCEMIFENLAKFREHVRKAHSTSTHDGTEPMEKSDHLENATSAVVKRPLTPSLSKTSGDFSAVTSPKNFRCDYCEEAFAEVTHLIRHKLKIHNIKTTGFRIGCKECGVAFTNRSDFARHRIDVHNSWGGGKSPGAQEPSSPLTMSSSESEDFSPSDGEEYTPSNQSRGRSRMPSLSKETLLKKNPPSTSDQVVVHKVDTSKSYLGNFCTCGTHFFERKNLLSHIQRKTCQWNFTCKVCGKDFFYNSTLKRHMMKTHKFTNVYGGKNKTFGCVICGKTFKCWMKLRQHRALMHKLDSEAQDVITDGMQSFAKERPSRKTSGDLGEGNAQEIPPNLEEPEQPSHGVDVTQAMKGYYCLCGKKCSSERSLTVHTTYATKDRNIPCNRCGQRFVSPSYLRQHMQRAHNKAGIARSSAGRSKNTCKKCGKTLKSSVELIRHTRTVHAQKNMTRIKSCIPRRRPDAKSDSNVNHHQVPGRNSGLHMCSCGKEYLTKSGLHKHIRNLNRGKVFECEWCQKCFAERSGLRVHVGSQHKVNLLQDDMYGCLLCDMSVPPFPSMEEIVEHRVLSHNMVI